MFARKRSTKMGDMAQLRKDIDDILGRISKDFDKSIDHFKYNEQVKQLTKKVQTFVDKVKQDVGRKWDSAKNDVGQIRMDCHQILTKFSADFKYEVDNLKLNECANDVKERFSTIFNNAWKLINEKMEEYHIRDETVKVRIEVERILTEISTEFEKQYEHIKDNPQVKDMIKNFRKINESVNKEVGKMLEDTKNNRDHIRKDMRDILKKISTDFDKNVKAVADNDKIKDMVSTSKKLANKASTDVTGLLDNMKQKLDDFKFKDEVSKAHKYVNNIIENLATEFKEQLKHLENNEHVKQAQKNFESIVDKAKTKISEIFENAKETRSEIHKKVHDLLKTISADFEKTIENIKDGEIFNELKQTVKKVEEKASADISNLMDGLKQKFEEFSKNEKVVQARKEIDNALTKVSDEIEKEHEHIKDNYYVKEALNKFHNIQDRVREDINNHLDHLRTNREKVKSEVKEVLHKMSSDFEAAVHHVQENEYVKDISQKVKNISARVTSDVSKILENVKENDRIAKKLDYGHDNLKNEETQTQNFEPRKQYLNEKKYNSLYGDPSKAFDTVKKDTDKILEGAKEMLQGVGREVETSLVKKGQKNSEGAVKAAGPPLGLYRLGDILWLIFNRIFWVIAFTVMSIPAIFCHFLVLIRPKNLNGAVVVITGAGNGLGRALAKKFVLQGARVACVDVSTKDNEASAELLRRETEDPDHVRTYTCDVSNPECAKKLAEAIWHDFGKISILVNNAGIVCCHKITEGSDEAIQRTIEVNLISNFWMVRAFLPKMRSQQEGHIVFINSESGIHGLPNASSYGASKAGLLGLAYSLEGELRRDPKLKNIKVSSVHPIYFNSRPEIESHTNLKSKMLTVDEVADLIIHGIRRELFTFCIPFVYGGFVVSSLIRLLPPRMYHALVDTIVGGVKDTVRPAFRDPAAQNKKLMLG